MTITNEEYCSLSPQDRHFYLENKDKMELAVRNGKIYIVVPNNQPYVTWARFQEILKLQDNLSPEEDRALHFFGNFGDWNPFSRPYLEYGFYYDINISARSCALEELGIDTPVKNWFIERLLAHGFTHEQAATVRYTGGFTSFLGGKVSKSDTYSIEIRCRFTDIPPHYIPEKVHKWAKRNPQYKSLIFA